MDRSEEVMYLFSDSETGIKIDSTNFSSSTWKKRKTSLAGVDLELCNSLILGEYDMPIVQPYHGKLPRYNTLFSHRNQVPSRDCLVMFFEDDVSFERVYTEKDKYLRDLSHFSATCSPDFSLYLDMPDSELRHNSFRNKALAQLWQNNGLKVIPTIGWAGPSSYDYCFSGYSEGGIVAISTNGIFRNYVTSKYFRMGFYEMEKRLKPDTILIYGSPIDIRHRAGIVLIPNTNIDRLRQINKKS